MDPEIKRESAEFLKFLRELQKKITDFSFSIDLGEDYSDKDIRELFGYYKQYKLNSK